MLLSLLSKRSLDVESRDAYGFTVRPQYVQSYREYAKIYKEEEEERSKKWIDFLQLQKESDWAILSKEENISTSLAEVRELHKEHVSNVRGEGDNLTGGKTEPFLGDHGEVDSLNGENTEPILPLSYQDLYSRGRNGVPVPTLTGKVDNASWIKAGPNSEVCEEGHHSSYGRGDIATGCKVEPNVEVCEEGDHSRGIKAELDPEVSEEVDHSSVRKVDPGSEVREDGGSLSGTKREPESELFEEGDSSSVEKIEPSLKIDFEGDHPGEVKTVLNADCDAAKEVSTTRQTKRCKVQTWAPIRPSLYSLENLMSFHVKKRDNMKLKHVTATQNDVQTNQDEKPSRVESEDFEEVPKNSKVDDDTVLASGDGNCIVSPEPFFPWKEVEFLVHGGVPRDFRGEVWQAFVGVRARRVERYYQDLLALSIDACDGPKHNNVLQDKDINRHNRDKLDTPEKWRKQIEKDLPRTFPGHPALNEDGRKSLRRILVAYSRHNPSVGYCQAMNFFAGLLLLMMPEENAFWTLVGLIDDYFNGYYSEEMIESQVDQLVFEELMCERFPKLVNHLNYLGVQVTWLSGPWFLSIFVNMLPWESVLRIWDVLLFEGNRVMLFRTALALMELYGPAIVTTKDAGDAITLLQSLIGSTFDSSQLVLTACVGFLTVTEIRLQQLREKHRPAVLEALEERSVGSQLKDFKGLASKLYSFKHDHGSLKKENNIKEPGDKKSYGDALQSGYPFNTDELLSSLNINSELDSLPDLQEQVVWLKVELCRLLEEKRSATLRAEELEAALVEIVTQDNRRQLSARVEQLEQEVAELQQAIANKKEQENAMLEVLLRVEQEQKVTEDARIFAEQDAAAQRYAVHVLQEKYDQAMASVAQMEKRVVMAESVLEATLQYESGQNKAVTSARVGRAEASPIRKIGLLSFGLGGWRAGNKGKQSSAPATSQTISADEEQETSRMQTNNRNNYYNNKQQSEKN